MAEKKKKTGSGLLCVTLILVTLFSAFFLIREAGHDCSGGNCPICACLRQAEQNLKQLGTGIPACAAVIPAVFLFMQVLSGAPDCLYCDTPVSRKVRLNN